MHHMSKTRKILVPIILLLGVVQFIPHEHPAVNTDSQHAFKATETEVQNILDKACMDCHSNATRYPWYVNVVPINYLIDNHVKEGREHLNFSEWNTYPPHDRKKHAEEIVEVVKEKEMPLLSYWLIHWDAKLTDAEREALIRYFE